MAGRGTPPKDASKRKNPRSKPTHEWVAAPGDGWQHGPIPDAPDGLMPASVDAWSTWLKAWFAAHWTPADLPGLRQLIRIHDRVERGEFQRHGELRIGMDTYGITPKGQQDRRWRPPVEGEGAPASRPSKPSAYGRLRAVND